MSPRASAPSTKSALISISGFGCRLEEVLRFEYPKRQAVGKEALEGMPDQITPEYPVDVEAEAASEQRQEVTRRAARPTPATGVGLKSLQSPRETQQASLVERNFQRASVLTATRR